MSSKNFSFIRVAPIPTWGMGKRRKGGKPGKNTGLAGHVAHDLRFLVTDNADPARMQKNVILCDKTGWKPVFASKENLESLGINDPNFLSEIAKQKLTAMGIKAQENHVKCAAFINSVSPEFIRDGSETGQINSQKVQAWMRATIKYNRKKHGDNLLMICFHMDELNPHASVYALPVREKLIKELGPPRKNEKGEPRKTKKVWRLDYWGIYTRDLCKYEIDEKTNEKKLVRIADGTCTQMQDEYHQAMLDEGLDVQRGMRKDPNAPALKHQTIRKYYGNKKRALEEVSRMTMDDLRDFVTEKVEMINQVDRLTDERTHYQLAGAAAQTKATELEKRIEESMRDIPVADVIRAITGTDATSSDDRSKGPPESPPKTKPAATRLEFQLPNGQRLGVDTARNRFENLTPHIPFLGEGANRRSASGSFNAVMYLTGCSYDSAAARLASLFGNDATKRAAAKKIEEEAAVTKRRLITHDDSKWPELLAKLRTWRIDEATLDNLKKNDRMAANREGHIIFRKEYWDDSLEQNRHDSGVVVVDPLFPYVNVLETGDNGLFLVLDPKATHTIICATATDVLAIKSLPMNKDANVIGIGTHQNENTLRTVKMFLNVFPSKTSYAENLLKAGRKIAKWLTENFDDQIKMIPLPDGYRHWLDYHLASIKSALDQKIVPIKTRKIAESDEIAGK